MSMPKHRMWGIRPVGFFHLCSVRIDPGQVLQPSSRLLSSQKEIAAKNGYIQGGAASASARSSQDSPFSFQVPIQPTDLVVLAIRVIVALLGAAELVACEIMGVPCEK